jgi:hypothetical protein
MIFTLPLYEVEMDGNEGLLGWSETTFTIKNTEGHLLNVAGRITLDVADIANVEYNQLMQGLIEHEMGHSLGVGTLFYDNGLQSGKDDALYYTGQAANQAWRDMGCSGFIPIESHGPRGTYGCHWEEYCLVGELMTGYIGDGNYLSRITIGSLQDLGYTVNMDAADYFGLDQLNAYGCGDYCPEAAGYFSTQSTSSSISSTSGTSSKSEAKLQHTMMTIATAVLQQNQANRPMSLPEGIQYVGGDSIRMLTLGSNGRLEVTTITWDDVQEFLNNPPSN